MKRPAPRPAAAAIVVHGLADARTALAAARDLARPVVLWSAPNAGIYAGPGWFAALIDQAAAAEPGARFEAVLDCGDDAAAVTEALRTGIRRIRFAGPVAMRRKLVQIAAAQQGTLIDARPDAFDPQDRPDPAGGMRAWLQSHEPDVKSHSEPTKQKR